MFIGHFAPAFIARGATEEAPKLGPLFIAAQLADWALFLLAIVGIEKLRIVPGFTEMVPLDLYHMPYTHSLLGTAVLAFAFAALIWFLTRNMVAATWTAIVVLSHWVLDLVTHAPDMTIAGGEQKYGFGLWDSPMIAMPIEIGLVLFAYWFYIRRTKGPLVPPLILLGTMLVFQAVNWFGPPPTEAGIGFYLTAMLGFAVLTAMAFWVQTTRWHKNTVGLAVSGARR